MVSGDYPALLRKKLGARLPSFTAEQSALLKGSYDLLQQNYYSGSLITPCGSATSRTACSTLEPGWFTDMGVDESQVPAGALRGKGACANSFGFAPSYLEAIEWVHNFDKSADILLTENGWCGAEEIDDKDKVTYLRTHLAQVHKAITVKKLPIIGYTVWSFMDNYEWGSYKPRYGLYHVDFPDNIGSADLVSLSAPYLMRTPRTAASFVSSVAKSGCLTLEPGDEKWF